MPFQPRNLVVLSDGTGNSAAKLFRTNVWRIYEALDLNCPDQVALYDDGVGTAAFKPLAVLGGAFGYGLKRNVLDLYTFLCRNYRAAPGYTYDSSQPSSDDASQHDRIFAFGFSRGAFTARVVASLVANEGLIHRAETDAELERLARWAYRSYRAKRYKGRFLVGLFRRFRDVAVRLIEIRKPAYDRRKNRDVPVDFIGVFDTVAAYGLPIDELTRGWDQWVWPMTPRDRTLNDRVKIARHAVAIDDERQTFFPVLWDEDSASQQERNAKYQHAPDRIQQVWFAGMHSNVGGGYADDALSYGPLCWMAREAFARGLRFQASLRPKGDAIPESWVDRAASCAPMGDSRRGAGAYYRYHPRPIAQLCGFKGHADKRDPKSLVHIDRPKIHESVFERIEDRRDNYAPLGLPKNYAVLTRTGAVLEGDAPAANANPFEHSTQAQSRVFEQQAAWDQVWIRRVVYFTTVLATLFLLALPVMPLPRIVGDNSHTLAVTIGALAGFLPGFAGNWIGAYSQHPGWFTVVAATVGILLFMGSRLKRSVNDRMLRVWAHVNRGHLRASASKAQAHPPGGWIYRLRESRGYKAVFSFLSTVFWPNVFGILMLAIIAGAIPLRLAFQVSSRLNGFGIESSAILSSSANGIPAHEVWFYPDEIQRNTPVRIERGRRYAIQIAIPAGDAATSCETAGLSEDQKKRIGGWRDGPLDVTSTTGITGTTRMKLFSGFRRIWMLDWFVPVASIGDAVPDRHYLTKPVTEFTATRSDILSLFVNDAAFPINLPGCVLAWDCYYRNNSGGPARVRVSELDATTPVSALPELTPYTCAEQVAKLNDPGAGK